LIPAFAGMKSGLGRPYCSNDTSPRQFEYTIMRKMSRFELCMLKTDRRRGSPWAHSLIAEWIFDATFFVSIPATRQVRIQQDIMQRPDGSELDTKSV
jgi:hypothetical protein